MDIKKRRNKEIGSGGDVDVEEDAKKISFTERVTNEEVLRRMEEERQLLNLIRNRHNNWIGYIVRVDGIAKEVI